MTTTTKITTIYEAIAQYGGHVCYGRTKDEARAKARRRNPTATVIVRRVRTAAVIVRALERAGRL